MEMVMMVTNIVSGDQVAQVGLSECNILHLLCTWVMYITPSSGSYGRHFFCRHKHKVLVRKGLIAQCLWSFNTFCLVYRLPWASSRCSECRTYHPEEPQFHCSWCYINCKSRKFAYLETIMKITNFCSSSVRLRWPSSTHSPAPPKAAKHPLSSQTVLLVSTESILNGDQML